MPEEEGKGMNESIKYKLRYKLTDLKDDENVLISTCKISKNGELIGVGLSNSLIKIYDLSTGKLKYKLVGHNKGISDLEFSPNNKYLSSASDDLTIRIWDLKFQECIKILKNHTFHINCIKWDKRSRILISGSSDESIKIWDCKRARSMRTLSAHSDPVSSIDLNFDDTIIVSGSYDGLIRLFDTETGGCLKTLIYDKEGLSFPISYVKFSPNSKYILSSSLDGVLRLWDYMNNKVVKTFKNKNNLPITEKYSLSSNFIIFNNESMINSGDQFGNIIFWDIQSQNILFTLKASEKKSPIMQVDSFEDGKILASVSLDGELCVWDYCSNV